jgi:hypothetical protein
MSQSPLKTILENIKITPGFRLLLKWQSDEIWRFKTNVFEQAALRNRTEFQPYSPRRRGGASKWCPVPAGNNYQTPNSPVYGRSAIQTIIWVYARFFAGMTGYAGHYF